MKKNYVMPLTKASESKLRTSILAGSNGTRPDGSPRPNGTDGTTVGGPTNSFDAKKRMITEF